MAYEIFKLSNASDWDKTEKPTITLLFGDPGWEEALKRWRTGANPTDSKEWKKGVIASTRLVHTVTVKVVCKTCEGCGDPFYVDMPPEDIIYTKVRPDQLTHVDRERLDELGWHVDAELRVMAWRTGRFCD